MESKNNEQIKLESQDWQITNAFVGILSILAPAACLAFVLGHTGILTDFIFNINYSKSKVSAPLVFSSWLLSFIHWPLQNRQRYLKNSNFHIRNADTQNPIHVWKDGSLLCTLVNTAVPGACKDPREHRLQPPRHGMQLVYEYMDIQAIFTSDELDQQQLTPPQERKFSKYLNTVHKYIKKQTDIISNMKFSTDYVARGMGLVIGEQHRKSTFYIYPIPKQNQQPCDLEVSIKGPCRISGHITIPSILHYQQKWQPATEYKRALYMTSKLNSISPTTQGTSFLRRLSITSLTKPRDPELNIDIRVKISPTRAKVSYIPQKTGIYEISLICRSYHVVGSPYSVPIELPSNSSYLSNDSDNESDGANEGKYVKRKKKIISQIVDFIDEKMLLQNDGTLVKIDKKENQNFGKNNEIEETCNCTLRRNEESINSKIDNNNDKINEDAIKNKIDLENNLIFITKLDLNINDNSQSSSNEDSENKENKFDAVLKENSELEKSIPEEIDKTVIVDNLNNYKYKEELNLEKNKEQKYDNLYQQKTLSIEIYKTNNEQKKVENKSKFEEIKDLKLVDNDLKVKNKLEKYLPENDYETVVEKIQLQPNFDKINQPILKEKIGNVSNVKKTKNIFTNNNDDETVQNNLKLNIPENAQLELSQNENVKEMHQVLIVKSNLITSQNQTDIHPSLELNNNTVLNSNLNYAAGITSFENSPQNSNEISNYSPPDILESFSNNTENSVPFTSKVNDKQKIKFVIKSFVDPTLIGKVKDPAINFSIAESEYRKTFSNKDPSKEYNFPKTNTNNNLVNKLVKIFNDPQQTFSSDRNENKNKINNKNIFQNTSFNGPDLVKCHIKNFVSLNFNNNDSKTNKDLLQKKLKSIGAIHDNFDEHQYYLKNSLKQNIELYFSEKLLQKIKKDKTIEQNIRLGIVDKQKHFWDQKIYNKIFDNKIQEQKIIFKDKFNNKTTENIPENYNVQFKPFKGIVENNVKIFESKLCSLTTSCNKKEKIEKKNLQKSKSESFLNGLKDSNTYILQKSVSNEEIIKVPSIEERKNKFLKACQQSFPSVTKNITEKDNNNIPVTEKEVYELEPTPKEKTLLPEQIAFQEILYTTGKNSSVRRKARFKRAKLFFHQLEGSKSQLTMNTTLQIDNPSKITDLSRSESDPCVAYSNTSTFAKSLRISDRFPVNDLFQDILGDDKRFIGIPNKTAVVASLASLDSDSSRNAYESANDEPDIDYFIKRPKKVRKKKKTIPGFHEDYPYPPSTDTWGFKTRNIAQNEELIPGRILLTKSENELEKQIEEKFESK